MIIRDDICNRSDDGLPPTELPDRTERFNAVGGAQHIIVNYRPLSSVMFFSRLLREKFAGTPYAKHYLAGEV